MAGRVWAWFFTEADIYKHLAVTLIETLLAFGIGSVLGLAAGLWLALSPMASALLEPYVKGLNAMPRIILAPIFAVWFGLGIASKVALGVTLVFFIVFFNVYQGVKEVSPVVLANARMLGAGQRQFAVPHGSTSSHLPSLQSKRSATPIATSRCRQLLRSGCDWPDSKRKRSEDEKQVYIPPKSKRAG